MRMKIWKSMSAATLAMAFVAGASVAHAQAVPPESTAQDMLPLPEAAPAVTGAAPVVTMSDSFDSLDRDKDGAVTENEAQRSEPVASAFRRLDESHDGKLDLAEFAQLRPVARARN